MKTLLQGIAAAAFVVLISIARAQTPLGYVQVAGSLTTDSTGAPVANGTIAFAPVDQTGKPLGYRVNGAGHAITAPVTTLVTAGAFSIRLADTALTDPVNVCFAVTVTDNTSGKSYLGPGYECFQPAGSGPVVDSGLCTAASGSAGGTCNFDKFIPNIPGLPITGGGGGGSGGGGSPPGGVSGEVQINNGGILGSIPGFKYTNSGGNPFLDGRSSPPSGLALAVGYVGATNIGTGFNGSYLESLPYNLTTGGISGHVMACITSDGTAHACPTSSSYWNGLTWSTGTDPTNGPVASVAIAGSSKCLFDNTPTLGDFVVLSTTTAGRCHDAGAAMPSSGTLVGQVTGAAAAGEAPVYLMHGGGGSGGSGSMTATQIDAALNYPAVTVYGFSAGDMCAQLTAAETWAQTTQGWKGAIFDARGFRGNQTCTGSEQLFGGVTYTPGNGAIFKPVILLGADLNLIVDNQQVYPGEAQVLGMGTNNIGCGFGCGPVIEISNSFPANTALIEYGPNPGAGTTPPEGIYMQGVNLTCKAPNGSRPQGSIGIQNQFAQENSGAKYIAISNCDVGLDKEGGSGPSQTGSENDGPWENFHVELNAQTVNAHCIQYGTTTTAAGMQAGRPIQNWSCNLGTSSSRTVSDAVTNGTTTVTSATASFVSSGYNTDVGRIVTGTNIPLFTVITAVVNATTVTISQAATGSGTNSLTIKVEPQVAVMVDNWGTPQSFEHLHFEGFNVGLELGSITGARAVLINDVELISSQSAQVTSVVDIAQLSRTVTDAVTTNGSPTLTSATANFTFADLGSTVTGAGIPAFTTIVSVQSATSVTMTANATGPGTTVTIADLSPTGILLTGITSGGIATYLVNDHGVNGGQVPGISSRQILAMYSRDSTNCVFSTNQSAIVNCPNMVTSSAANTFSGPTTFTATTHHQGVLALDALGVASGTNFASNVLEPCVSYGAGVSNCTGKFSISPGAGATPAIFWTLTPVTGAGTNFFEFGNNANPVTADFYTSPRLYNSAGTFNAMFANPNLSASYVLTLPGFAATVGTGLSIINGAPTFTPGANITSAACAASYTCTNTRGRITIAAGASATTGTIATLNFSAALAAGPFCTVAEMGATSLHGLDHLVPTQTALTITAAASVASATINVDYFCAP